MVLPFEMEMNQSLPTIEQPTRIGPHVEDDHRADHSYNKLHMVHENSSP